MKYIGARRVHNSTAVVFLAVVSLCVMVARLVEVQILKGSNFRVQADANRQYSVRLPKQRGLFYDRYGYLLATNIPVFSRVDNPQQLFSAEKRIAREEGLALAATDSARVVPGFERVYPLGLAAAHVVGYVSPATAEDVAKYGLSAKDSVGRYGLERVLDAELQGTAGEDIFEINALGRKMKKLSTKPATTGTDIHTTLDSFLSAVSARALGDKKGSVIIQDALSGEVLALVNTPSFDPNVFTLKYFDQKLEEERQEKLNGYFTDAGLPFFDRAISGEYPPGSVFKLVTALAGLQTGSLTTETKVKDEGRLTIDSYSFGNWYYSQYGRVEGELSLTRALARSNDIYFYKAAEWIGPTALAQFARDFGYGSLTGSILPGEKAGFVPTPEWKETSTGERWYLGNTYHFGIGQGDLLVTPLQVAQVTQALAKRGSKCLPKLVGMDVASCKDVGVSEEHLVPVLSGMIDACSTGGTAFPFFSWNTERRAAGVTNPYEQIDAGVVACKTGTAEFGGVTTDNKRKTHGWFTMIVGTEVLLKEQLAQPVSEEKMKELPLSSLEDFYDHATWLHKVKEKGFPKTLAITVLVESDETSPYREGSKDAAPVAFEISQWIVGK